MSNYSVSVNNGSFSINAETQSIALSLSRTGGQGAKGDSVSDIYLDNNNDLIVEISDGAGNVINNINLGQGNTLSKLANFEGFYAGESATEPTTLLDGTTPVSAGSIFFNTTTNEVGFYNGTAWEYPALEAASSESIALSSATSASNSASSASTSEANAATSATNAATSAANAAASAANASASETNALASQSAAATSAANAATSETNANNSASTASSAATSASASAATAVSSASAASTSETNAASSAALASVSESNASVSASNAAISATSASTSATNASNSAASASTSAASASTSAASAASDLAAVQTLFDNFDDRFLGTKASDPTLDNDGNALLTGAFYYNSTTNELKVYDGANWIAPSTSASNSASAAASSASSAASSATAAASAQVAAESAKTAAELAQTAAETAYDNFDDRYLGAKASAPALDNDGDALVTGALYYDTTVSTMYVYSGSSWDAIVGGTLLNERNFIIGDASNQRTTANFDDEVNNIALALSIALG